MIGISKLYCGAVEPSDILRYGRSSSNLPSNLLQFSKDKTPVVVWNMTKKCNLKCVHCYAHATEGNVHNELTTDEGKSLIDDLVEFGCPVILFSGGEPLIREDLLKLASYAVEKGLRAVISTNGTLITRKVASSLKKIGLSYVGISLDGMEKINDQFRGVPGSFNKAISGIRNCIDADIKVGIRFTINRFNVNEIPKIFDFLEKEGIPRICFYHLVYAGRGSNLINDDLSLEDSRKIVDFILMRTKMMHDNNNPVEVLTVDNHADGPYLYMKMLKKDKDRANKIFELLRMNGGNSSGLGIGCVSWDGEVYADQFWRHYSFGNVRNKLFSKIWMNPNDNLLTKLKNKKKYVKGRCAGCKWLDLCGGNFRVRAEAVTGDIWASDPACYLLDSEIY